MIGRTLAKYLAIRFVRSIGLMFGVMFVLVYLIDFVEMLRRAVDIKGVSALYVAWLCLLRVPEIIEKTLPFATLFGSMAAFLGLSRKLELVVARSAGVSALQFLLPPVVLAAAIGIFSVAVFNPLATLAKQRADQIETQIFGKSTAQDDASGLWIRQKSGNQQAILRANHSSDQGTNLSAVNAFVFNPDGSFKERIDSASAILRIGFWQMRDARVLEPGHEPQISDDYRLASNLTAAQVNQSFGNPDSVSFWQLGPLIAVTELAGLDATPYRLRFQSLLAQPLLLVAMVLVAASFSLRFFRFGSVAQTVIGGVVAGFVLYLATKLVGDLGGAGIISVAMAAWTPAVTGTMLGVLALLYQEDG